MEKKLYETLISRALYFLEIAKEDKKRKRYDICLFHVEQGIQLALKAHLLKTRGDFPRTHDLAELFNLIKNECLKKLSEEKWYMIDILIDAYLGARYFSRVYHEKEANEAIKFAEEVFKCMNILNT